MWRFSKHGKSYSGQPKGTVHKVVSKFSRKAASTITQLRTGHGHFNSYLAGIPSSGVISKKCSCGTPNQDPRHLLLLCRNFKTERREMKKELKGLPLTLPILLYTKRGLSVLPKFLSTTGVATRLWRLGKEKDHVESWSSRIGWGRIPIHTQEEAEDSSREEQGEEAGEA